MPTPAQLGTLPGRLSRTPAVTTPLNGMVKSPAGKASAAAANRPTGRVFARWLLLRSARALPTLHASLTATGRPGVYRARLALPPWLRGTSRILRLAGARTLAVDVVVGTTKTRVRLPLPR